MESHYQELKIQPVTYAMMNNLGFAEGNVVKYISRYKKKGGLQDLRKARHYIELLIQTYEEPNRPTTYTDDAPTQL